MIIYYKGCKMRKILVVEDDESLRENICEILDASGYEPIFAVNGLDALEKVTASMPDLILSDIMMPKMDGYEFFEKFKELYNYHNVPFIFLTAKSSQSDIKKASDTGVSAYLIKPFRINELLDSIEYHLSKKEELKIH
jgi:CheY-like chemotaxis protein